MKVRILRSHTAEYQRFLQTLAERRGGGDALIDPAVTAIIDDVRKRGDRALVDLTTKFDGVRLQPTAIKIAAGELRSALNPLPAPDRDALELAAERIRDFHHRTMEESFVYRDRIGMRLGQIVRPLHRVGVYVPGGAGAYPSTVLMNAIPAKVAGVAEVV